MKLFIASDTHFEFGHEHDYGVPDGLDFDIAVFAGDIGKPRQAIEWMLRQTALKNKPVAYVLGNHEYYGGLLEDRGAGAPCEVDQGTAHAAAFRGRDGRRRRIRSVQGLKDSIWQQAVAKLAGPSATDLLRRLLAMSAPEAGFLSL